MSDIRKLNSFDTVKDGDGVCPCCGAGKMPFEEFCRDCTEYKQRATEARRAAARRRRFGGWL